MMNEVERFIYKFYEEKYKQYTGMLYKQYATSEFLTSGFWDVHITKVIYQNPATVVFWSDGTKTVAKCDKNDTYDDEKGFLICIFKKVFPNKRFDVLMNMWSSTTNDNYGNRTITLKEARKREKN